MSIIIRLQNLPWSARSGDIRHFFGGLRIPDGGVHIIGGEKGDAFIAFNSDEDARLAMRKDGGKIKDTRVKLLLSSHMEMQHIIERVTKQPFQKPPSPRSVSKERQRSQEPRSRKERSPESKSRRGRSPMRKRRDFSPRSSHHSREGAMSIERGRRRSRSPVKKSISPHESKKGDIVLSTYASDPLKDTRNVRALPPPDEQPHFQQVWGNDQVHVQRDNYKSLNTQGGRVPREDLQHSVEDMKRTLFTTLSDNRFPEDAPAFNNSIPFLKDEMTSLPQRERNYNAAGSMNENPMFPSRINPDESLMNIQHHGNSFSERTHFQHDMKIDDRERFRENEFQPNNFQPFPQTERIDFFDDPKTLHPLNVPEFDQSLRRSERADSTMLQPPPFPFAPLDEEQNKIQSDWNQRNPQNSENYCVRVMDLHPQATKKDVQSALKGIYAPHTNIKWEVDYQNRRTRVAIVKLSSREDFINVLSGNPYFIDNREIEILECPPHLGLKYFPLERERNIDTSQQHHKGFCYMLKGLPFSVTYDDVIHFFRGLNISDAFIIYDRANKATGTGYVEFYNEQDFISAMEMNGKKIGHRYIEMLVSSKVSIMKAKQKFGNLNQPSSFKPLFLNDEAQQQLKRRPLCALLTGLPFTIHVSQIHDFFEDSGIKPFAIHVMLNDKHKPNGRCFAEFLNPLDFESALKCHGNFIGNNMVCVKQVLHDEMIKILDTQEARHHHGSEECGRSSPKRGLNLPEKVPYLWEPPDANECDLTLNEDDNFKRSQNERPFKERAFEERGEFSNNRFSKQIKPEFSQSFFNEKFDRFHEQPRFMSDDLKHQQHERPMLENERVIANRMPSNPSGQYSNPVEEDIWNFRSGNNNNRGNEIRNFPPVQRDFDRPNMNDFDLPNITVFDRPNLRDFDRPNMNDFDRPNMSDFDRPNMRDFDRLNMSDLNRQNMGDLNRQNMGDLNRQNMGDFKSRNRDEGIDFQNPDFMRKSMDSFEPDKRGDNFNKNNFSPMENRNIPRYDDREKIVNQFNFPRQQPDLERDNLDFKPGNRLFKERDIPPQEPFFNLEKDNRDSFRFGKREMEADLTMNVPPWQQRVKCEVNVQDFQPDKKDEIRKRPGGATSRPESTEIASEDNSRAPVKFEMKTKVPVTGKIVDDAFISESEKKKKLSRLSPEKKDEKTSSKDHVRVKVEKEGSGSKLANASSKEPAHSHKSRNPSPNREKESSKRSSVPEKKTDKAVESDRSKDKTSQPTKENGRSNYDQRTRSDDRREKKEDYRPRSRSTHRSDFSSSSRSQTKDERKESAPGHTGCTVQLINVHPDIGLEEILDFFHNFDLRKDKVIRRYTDRGEATGDVRVCFKSSRDAERAMKLLNRHYLGGIPVEMFLV